MDLLEEWVRTLHRPPLEASVGHLGHREQGRACPCSKREMCLDLVTLTSGTPEVKTLRPVFQEVMTKSFVIRIAVEYLTKINIELFLKMHKSTLNLGTHFMSIVNCRVKLPTFLFQKAVSRRFLALESWPLSCQWAELSVLWMWVAAQPENLHGHQSGAEARFPRDILKLVRYRMECVGRRWCRSGLSGNRCSTTGPLTWPQQSCHPRLHTFQLSLGRNTLQASGSNFYQVKFCTSNYEEF